VRRYLRTHAKLSPAQVSVLQDALEVLSPEAFAPPVSPDVKESISKIFNEAIVVLGPKAADELFVTLGPKKLERANALPWRQQLADRVRGWRNVSAEYPDCNCNIDIDTCDLEPDPWLQCSSCTRATSTSTGRCAAPSGRGRARAGARSCAGRIRSTDAGFTTEWC
jgi:hypothetical protein